MCDVELSATGTWSRISSNIGSEHVSIALYFGIMQKIFFWQLPFGAPTEHYTHTIALFWGYLLYLVSVILLLPMYLLYSHLWGRFLLTRQKGLDYLRSVVDRTSCFLYVLSTSLTRQMYVVFGDHGVLPFVASQSPRLTIHGEEARSKTCHLHRFRVSFEDTKNTQKKYE